MSQCKRLKPSNLWTLWWWTDPQNEFSLRAKYDFDYEEFDSVSPEAKDFISRLLRKRADDRINSARFSRKIPKCLPLIRDSNPHLFVILALTQVPWTSLVGGVLSWKHHQGGEPQEVSCEVVPLPSTRIIAITIDILITIMIKPGERCKMLGECCAPSTFSGKCPRRRPGSNIFFITFFYYQWGQMIDNFCLK